ncbi:flippase [Geobacillus jurassicus]
MRRFGLTFHEVKSPVDVFVFCKYDVEMDEYTMQNGFIKNSLLNFNRNILAILLGFASSIIIARALGPEKQGIYTLVVLLPSMLFTFLNIGISSASVYYIGREKYSLGTIVSTNVFLALVISVISIIVGVLCIGLFKDVFFKSVPVAYLLLILSSLPFLFVTSFLQAVFQGLQAFGIFNLVSICGSIANLLFLAVGVLFLKLGVMGAITSFLASAITPLLLLIVFLKKRHIPIGAKYVSKEFIKDCLMYGYKAHLSNILAFLNYRIDILIISYFLSPMAVGVYNVAVSIAEKLWIVSQPVSAVLFPRISSSKDDAERNGLTAKVTRNVLFLSIVVGIGLFFVSDLLIGIMFGEKYEAASKLIKILLIGITLFSAERILSNDLAGRGKPELNLYTSLFTVVINIILNLLFIPKWSFYGAATATSVAYSLTFILKVWLFCRTTGSDVFSLLFINRMDIELYKSFSNKLIRREKN